MNRREFLQHSLLIAAGGALALHTQSTPLSNSNPSPPSITTDTQKSERRADIRSLDFDSHEFDLRFRFKF